MVGALANTYELSRAMYTDSMTRDVHVPDDVFNQVHPHFNDRGISDAKFAETMKILFDNQVVIF